MAGAAPRYAKALLEALESSGAFDAALPALRQLADLPSDLQSALGNPVLPAGSREAALRTALGNPKTDSVMSRFVSLLASRRRLGLVAQIAGETLALRETRAGVVHGTVESRTPLNPASISTLERSLSSQGRRVELSVRTDDSIIGGFRVRLGDVLLDATANNQLNQARRALLSA
jgi:F-type H+-transporting ATPase subunit delta